MTDRIYWGEIVNHGKPWEEASKRQAGYLAVNIVRALELDIRKMDEQMNMAETEGRSDDIS